MYLDFHILLIEDSPADAKIIERALREIRGDHRLTVIRDGRSALDYLRRCRRSHPDPADEPDLILLDLNLPGLDGSQVLIEINRDAHLRPIPVVVLTSSAREEEIWQSYQAGANTYIQKPPEYPGYRELVATLRSYWLETALRPRLRLPGSPTEDGGGWPPGSPPVE